MEYLLTPTNIRILESFCFANTLFAFDYDGTLAPITEKPELAVMDSEVSSLLGVLMKSYPVALITGRSVDDLRKFLPAVPEILIGNHGSEGLLSPHLLDEMRSDCETWIRIISQALPVLVEMGVSVENKTYSLTFHYRHSENPEIARIAIEQIVSRLPRSRVFGGKYIVNVVPRDSINKGNALEILMQKRNYKFGIYFGDDLTDEDVFRVRNPRLLTVKIGTEPSQARYFLKEQREIADVLKLLTEFFNAERALR